MEFLESMENWGILMLCVEIPPRTGGRLVPQQKRFLADAMVHLFL